MRRSIHPMRVITGILRPMASLSCAYFTDANMHHKLADPGIRVELLIHSLGTQRLWPAVIDAPLPSFVLLAGGGSRADSEAPQDNEAASPGDGGGRLSLAESSSLAVQECIATRPSLD